MAKIKYKFSYFNVRNNAWEFLLKNEVKSYPLDLRRIAINNGWLIWNYERYCARFGEDIAKLRAKYPDGFSVRHREHIIICYNDNNNRHRNRFTICHEFGHLVLHSIYKGKKLEREANMFSARILMPMLLIKELSITTPEELSALCDVSIEASAFRLKRYREIYSQGKFYTNPLEQSLLHQLEDFIQRSKT